MDKLRFIVTWMAVGFVLAVITFVLGLEYFPRYITLTISILSLSILLFVVLMVSFTTHKNMPKGFEQKIDHFVDAIHQTFYDSDLDAKKEEGIKSLVSSVYGLANKVFTSTFVMGLVFSTTMILVGVLAYAVVLRQNNIIQKQNYLICQQNQFLEGSNKFGSYSMSKNQAMYNLSTMEEKISEELSRFNNCNSKDSIEKSIACYVNGDATSEGGMNSLQIRQMRIIPSLEEILSIKSKLMLLRINLEKSDELLKPSEKELFARYNVLLVEADKNIKKQIEDFKEGADMELKNMFNPINCDEYKPSE